MNKFILVVVLLLVGCGKSAKEDCSRRFMWGENLIVCQEKNAAEKESIKEERKVIGEAYLESNIFNDYWGVTTYGPYEQGKSYKWFFVYLVLDAVDNKIKVQYERPGYDSPDAAWVDKGKVFFYDDIDPVKVARENARKKIEGRK